MTKSKPEQFEFQSEVQQLLNILVYSLYKHKEVFVRELVSNSVDALNKIQFEALTREEGRTVLVAPVCGEDPDVPVSRLAYSPVRDGRFRVRSIDGRNPAQAFSWEVKAVRKNVSPVVVEPKRDEVEVGGVGPYKWYREKSAESKVQGALSGGSTQ